MMADNEIETDYGCVRLWFQTPNTIEITTEKRSNE